MFGRAIEVVLEKKRDDYSTRNVVCYWKNVFVTMLIRQKRREQKGA